MISRVKFWNFQPSLVMQVNIWSIFLSSDSRHVSPPFVMFHLSSYVFRSFFPPSLLPSERKTKRYLPFFSFPPDLGCLPAANRINRPLIKTGCACSCASCLLGEVVCDVRTVEAHEREVVRCPVISWWPGVYTPSDIRTRRRTLLGVTRYSVPLWDQGPSGIVSKIQSIV